MHTLPFSICKVGNLNMNEIERSGGIYTWRGLRKFLGLDERSEVFREQDRASVLPIVETRFVTRVSIEMCGDWKGGECGLLSGVGMCGWCWFASPAPTIVIAIASSCIARGLIWQYGMVQVMIRR